MSYYLESVWQTALFLGLPLFALFYHFPSKGWRGPGYTWLPGLGRWLADRLFDFRNRNIPAQAGDDFDDDDELSSAISRRVARSARHHPGAAPVQGPGGPRDDAAVQDGAVVQPDVLPGFDPNARAIPIDDIRDQHGVPVP